VNPPQPDFEPRRFRSTVPFYARYRLNYPPELIARVSETVGLAAGDKVMDLGCGPGLLAISFAQAGTRVTAVDPEPDMLAAARQAASEARAEVDCREGSSFEMPPDIGPFKLVTMGRSFHWMDRTETLRTLDQLILPGGAIALFEDDHPRTVENGWRSVLEEVGKRYGSHEAAHRAAARKSDYRSHISYLFESAFSHLVRIGVFVHRAITIDEIVGRAFSLSMLSPEKLSDRAQSFEADLREVLAPLATNGAFTEIAELAAIVAMRR
jgi:ubiquinone/menaquinone biosynthesis C-methylase UbiE